MTDLFIHLVAYQLVKARCPSALFLRQRNTALKMTKNATLLYF